MEWIEILSHSNEDENETTVNWSEPIERHLLKIIQKCTTKRLFGLVWFGSNHIFFIFIETEYYCFNFFERVSLLRDRCRFFFRG